MLLQPLKALSATVVLVPWKTTCVRFEHPWKAFPPMLSTFWGMTTWVISPQPSNAPSAMVVDSKVLSEVAYLRVHPIAVKVPLFLMAYESAAGVLALPSWLVSPFTVSSSNAVRVAEIAERVPSFKMPVPRENFTTAPLAMTRRFPAGMRTLFRTTWTTPAPQTSSPSRVPSWMTTSDLLITRTLAVALSPLDSSRVCMPSLTVVESHVGEDADQPAAVAPSALRLFPLEPVVAVDETRTLPFSRGSPRFSMEMGEASFASRGTPSARVRHERITVKRIGEYLFIVVEPMLLPY